MSSQKLNLAIKKAMENIKISPNFFDEFFYFKKIENGHIRVSFIVPEEWRERLKKTYLKN